MGYVDEYQTMRNHFQKDLSCPMNFHPHTTALHCESSFLHHHTATPTIGSKSFCCRKMAFLNFLLTTHKFMSDSIKNNTGTATSTGFSRSPLADLSWSTETVTLCPPIFILKVLQLNYLVTVLIGSLKGCAMIIPMKEYEFGLL